MSKALFVFVALLTGCAAPAEISRPPKSQVRVDETYTIDPSAPPRLAVVVGTVVVADSGGVANHLGGVPSDAAQTYRAFFGERFPPVASEAAHLSEVRALGSAPYDRAGVGLRPADGVRLAFDGFDPDLVLFLDTLHVGRAVYAGVVRTGPNGEFLGGGNHEALRLDADVVLWDNRTGREVAAGRLDSDRSLGGLPAGRRAYEAAIGRFVEQLARFTPVDLRSEVQRRPRRR